MKLNDSAAVRWLLISVMVITLAGSCRSSGSPEQSIATTSTSSTIAMNSTESKPESITEHLKLGETDRVIINYSPEGDAETNVARKYTIENEITIRQIIELLDRIPARGPGLLVKLSSNAPEFHLEFYAAQRVLGELRAKNSKLDSPVGRGWSFYTGGDEEFIKLLQQIVD